MNDMTKEARWKQQAVLVTGASGVMGKALLSNLHANGYERVKYISSADADLTDSKQAEFLITKEKPDLIFHLAARVSGIMGNMRNRGVAYLDNIRINTNVIEAARIANVKKIVAMGTTAIYSDLVKLPMSEDDLWLGPPHHSEAPYGHAKRSMLAQLDAYREQYGIEYAFCISTNLFGPHDKFDEATGHVIPSLISKFQRAITTGGPVEVWGTGSAQRDFLFSKDAAEAVRLIAEGGDGPINMASGKPVSIRQCVETISRIVGYKGEIIWDTTKPNGQMMRSYNIDKLVNLGFCTKYSLEDGLSETFDWYKSNVASARR